jgi:hypothetical protein
MRTAKLLTAAAAVGCIPLLVLACSSAPEAPGDPCEPDGDPCPGGTACQSNGDDEFICKIVPGGSCDAAADDPFCANGTSCLADADGGGSSCYFGSGSSCDPAAAESFCAPDLICGTDAEGNSRCGKPPGAECNAELTGECAPPLVCEANTEGVTVCSIPEGGECDPTLDDPHCAGANVCAEKQSGGYACFPPILVKGRVFDATTDAGIEGAHVLGLDDQSTAITDVAISAMDGAYSLDLPVVRNDDGSPIDVIFTLRASAQDYQTFPSGIRTSLPIQTSSAMTDMDGAYLIQLPLTDISLIPLPTTEQGRPSISGTVLAEERSAGVMVVAESGGAGLTAVSDKKGAYTIFNVPSGSYTVNGYAAGLALVPVSTSVASAPVTGVDLSPSSSALGSISGSIQIVNAPGGSKTSVVLVLESTFDDTFVRGEVPRGLRAPLSGPPTVDGAFTIADVPPGAYVVLAAFENDSLVRDPDPNIAGTQIVHITMPDPGQSIDLPDSFKITEALEIISPGAGDPEVVSGTPTFQWVDDSSEQFYSIVVYNAYGELVWEDPNVPGVSGGNVSVPYAGPALESGMYYQFRATSWRQSGMQPAGPISQTEDLKGVFIAQ